MKKLNENSEFVNAVANQMIFTASENFKLGTLDTVYTAAGNAEGVVDVEWFGGHALDGTMVWVDGKCRRLGKNSLANRVLSLKGLKCENIYISPNSPVPSGIHTANTGWAELPRGSRSVNDLANLGTSAKIHRLTYRTHP